ncbi:HD domain-containing protein [bacterium]|nr:HD domain-containing protein [bacterium]
MELTRDDHPFINDLQVGHFFDSYFVLRTLQMGTTRTNKPFLILDLTDKTGHIKGKMWEDAASAYQGLSEGLVVKVRAGVEEYQGAAELKVIRIRPLDPEDSQDVSRFLPSSGRDPEIDLEMIRSAIQRIEHPGLKELLGGLFGDEEFVSAYQTAPAGKRWHHGYLGGLLEHSASLVQLSTKLCEHYPKLNRDLLVAGAVLHDVGKLQELRFDTAIDYTVRGRLEGHIVLGAQFIEDRAASIEELDEPTLVQLKHLILSHQGSRENGCPVEPMTREAFVLYFLDEIDSKLNAIDRELEKAEGGGGAFTEYIHLLGRMLYKGEDAD